MRSHNRKFAAVFLVPALALAVWSILGNARGQVFVPQAHCVDSGVTCATCATGAGIIYCQTPIPPGYAYGDCHQGGNGCTFIQPHNCGPSFICGKDKLTGNKCIGGILICL